MNIEYTESDIEALDAKRRCALKLDDAWTREYNRKMIQGTNYSKMLTIYTDLGGFGLLAPDLNY